MYGWAFMALMRPETAVCHLLGLFCAQLFPCEAPQWAQDVFGGFITPALPVTVGLELDSPVYQVEMRCDLYTGFEPSQLSCLGFGA